ncbi:MAG TPA: hypothetical protein VIL43_08225 [Burkholderiales bacterium]
MKTLAPTVAGSLPAAERGTNGGAAAADLEGASQINATLERSVDVRRARPGDEVIARTSEDVVTQEGLAILRGTRLVGRVTEARAHAGGEGSAQGDAESRLGIVFEKAILKDGREFPLKVTIPAVAAARPEVQGRLGSAHEGGSGGVGLGGVASGGAGAAVDGAAGPPAHGGVPSSTGAVGGLSSSGRLLAGSRGVFGLRDLDIAAVGGARGTLITSASRDVRLDRGTRLLLVGSVMR